MMQTRRARFSAFLLVSALAHALVLAPAHNREREDVGASMSFATTINVALIDERPSRAASAAFDGRRKKTVRNNAPPQTAVPAEREAASAAPSAVVAEPAERASADGAESGPTDVSAATRNWLRARITDELGRYFTYPWIARQRGLSGTVVLAYRVEASGELRDIAVARSSGYALLDRAALADLRRVPPLRDAVPRLRGEPVEDTLAVIYRLRDN